MMMIMGMMGMMIRTRKKRREEIDGRLYLFYLLKINSKCRSAGSFEECCQSMGATPYAHFHQVSV